MPKVMELRDHIARVIFSHMDDIDGDEADWIYFQHMLRAAADDIIKRFDVKDWPMRIGACECRGCDGDAVGYSDDGIAMCEDCLFEWMEKQTILPGRFEDDDDYCRECMGPCKRRPRHGDGPNL